MKLDKKNLLLYAVTDRSWLGHRMLCEQVAEAIDGGATCVQLREKEATDESFLEEAVRLKELCQKRAVPLIINDHAELAVQCHADGVHVGQSDMDVTGVRALIGENMILGVSAHTVEQAIAAENGGADYLGVGAVFPTTTKGDASAVSYETLKTICSAVSIPVVAIGGITKENMIKLAGSGVAGVALVSAIFAQPDIAASCSELHALAKTYFRSAIVRA